MATFQPADELEVTITPVNPNVVKVAKDPWFRNVATPNMDIGYLMYGQGPTQTPEYEAANLPPYNGSSRPSGSLLSHFLL